MILVSGWKPGPSMANTMHHINITSTGDTTEFGEMHLRSGAGLSNNTRGIIGGAWNGSDRPGMHYISISSLGECIEFGNLTLNRWGAAIGNTASQTRGVFMGGSNSPSIHYNIIDYVNIQTLGDAIDFGDTTGVDASGNTKITYGAGISDCHGGLGGY